MIKNRTVQLMYLTMACTIGILGIIASTGFFNYVFRWDFYIHFTNLSNYFCIAILFKELFYVIKNKDKDGYIPVSPLLKFMGVLGILLTFLVFNIMLAPTRDPALNFNFNSICFHVIMPILYILDYFLFYERKDIKVTWPLISTLFPLIYIIFVFIHAAFWNFDSSVFVAGSTTPLIYPYFFLNLETQGVLGVIKWIAILCIAFIAGGYLLLGINKATSKKQ